MNSVRHYGADLFIDGERVEGVQSVSYSYAVPKQDYRIIGLGSTGLFGSSFPVCELSCERFVVSDTDIVTGYYNSFFNSHLRYFNNKNPTLKFSDLRSGVLNYLEYSCEVGGIAKSNFGAKYYSASGTQDSLSSNSPSYTPQVIKYGDVTVNVDDFSNNRIQSFSYRIDFDKPERPKIGTLENPEVNLLVPIKVTSSFSVSVNDLLVPNMVDQICQDGTDIEISMAICENTATRTLSCPNSDFVNFDSSIGIGGELLFNFSYESSFNSINDILGLIQ